MTIKQAQNDGYRVIPNEVRDPVIGRAETSSAPYASYGAPSQREGILRKRYFDSLSLAQYDSKGAHFAIIIFSQS